MRLLSVSALNSVVVNLAAVCVLLFQGSIPVQAEEDLDREFEFAAKLIEIDLPEYAELVIENVVRKHPDQKERADVIRAQALIARRHFNQAEEIVSTMPKDSPKAQAIKLALARGYYQAGKMDDCRNLYWGFFNQYTNRIPTDPDLLRFYRDATYEFGQMLAKADDPKAAAEMYDLLLQTLTDDEKMRQVRMEQAELILKAARTASGADLEGLLKKAAENCDEVLWGGMDLWFGRAVTCLAQIRILRGHQDEATKLLRSKLRILKTLDDLLREADIPVSESPFAGARSLLGTLYKERAELVLGTREQRESEALRNFERAFAELQAIWNLIVRINKHDTAILNREDRGRAALSGTATQRQKPFDDIASAMRQFDETLAECTGKEGWTPSVVKRANALKKKVHTVRNAISEYPKEAGVTPRPDIAMKEDFKGKVYVERGLAFLASEEARKQEGIEYYMKALQQFYNVFAGYPGSDWQSEAGEKVTVLKDRLKALTGKEVIIEAKKSGRRKIALVRLNEGRDLYSRKEYGKAVEEYLKGLNEYPEGDESIAALANLMECHAALKDALRAKMIALYLAERFAERPEIPQILLRMGRLYFEENNKEMYGYIYELYLDRFPNHPVAPTILYMLGEQRWRVEDYNGAVPYYRRITKKYVKSAYFVKSLDRIGWSYYLSKDYEKAAEVFGLLVAETRPGEKKARAKLCLADSCRLMNDYLKAIQHYKDLGKWLQEKNSPYTATEEAKRIHREILQQALFFQAYCLSRINEPADRVPTFREAAIALYRKFIEKFPSSELAPTALSSLGAVLMGQDKAEEAAKAYEELSTRFPESEAGQNARFAMIRSLMDIGHNEKAKAELGNMIANAESYPVDHFLRVGQLMLENDENESAARAFSQVVESLDRSSEDPKQRSNMEQRALFGLGKAYYASGNFEDAAKSIAELNSRYPTSGLFFEARFLLGNAYRELGKPDEAMEILRDVFKRASDQNLLNRATMELAGIQMARGDTAGALASCQRIVLLGNVDDPATRPHYEKALIESIRILVNMGRWQEVVENCDQYITHFPSGDGIAEVRKWRTKAVMQISLEAG